MACSDSLKSVCTVTLVTMCVIITGMGVFLYFTGYTKAEDFQVSGGDFITDFYIDYKGFSWYIFFCCCSCGLVLVFGLLAAQCKKPFIAVSYMIIALATALLLLYTSSLASKYKNETDTVCNNSDMINEINSDY